MCLPDSCLEQEILCVADNVSDELSTMNTLYFLTDEFTLFKTAFYVHIVEKQNKAVAVEQIMLTK